MDLLFRGLKFDDEFLTDYLERMSIKNGFINVNKFKKVLLNYFYEHNKGRHHNLTYQAVWRVSLELILKRNIPTDESTRFCNTKRVGFKKESKICQSCWSLKAYKRFYWWLAAYEKCHIHNELLVIDNLITLESKDNVIRNKKQQLLAKIVDEYSSLDSCQTLVFDELDRSNFDKYIIEGIACYFSFNEDVSLAVNELHSMWLSGAFLGKPADQRIQQILDVLTQLIGNSDFWLRIVSLIILSSKRGLDSNIPWNSKGREFTAFCHYFLSSDKLTVDLFLKINSFKKYKDMDDVCIEELLCEELLFSDSLLEKIKSSLFASRHVSFYTLQQPSTPNYVIKLLPSRAMAHSVNREL